MSGFDWKDVLSRAENIVERGPLPDEHAEHGPFCLWCAIALAKSQLDQEHGFQLDLSVLLEDVLLGVQERESDAPLSRARIALSEWNETDPHTITQAQALEALRSARLDD